MTLDADTNSAWPANRSLRSTIVAQFASDRADLLDSGAIELIQRSRTKTRKNPAKWEQMIEKNMVALKEQLATLSPQAEYEQGTT
ncbi:hypothetical protein V3390_01865 [Luteimonas sp. FXH3W]|uniref:Uncharacterized protein n=1 Tax=Aquilutibacter rugosus TaxID=3115820 RepID=A0ABU7UY92_9GAMM